MVSKKHHNHSSNNKNTKKGIVVISSEDQSSKDTVFLNNNGKKPKNVYYRENIKTLGLFTDTPNESLLNDNDSIQSKSINTLEKSGYFYKKGDVENDRKVDSHVVNHVNSFSSGEKESINQDANCIVSTTISSKKSFFSESDKGELNSNSFTTTTPFNNSTASTNTIPFNNFNISCTTNTIPFNNSTASTNTIPFNNPISCTNTIPFDNSISCTNTTSFNNSISCINTIPFNNSISCINTIPFNNSTASTNTIPFNNSNISCTTNTIPFNNSNISCTNTIPIFSVTGSTSSPKTICDIKPLDVGSDKFHSHSSVTIKDYTLSTIPIKTEANSTSIINTKSVNHEEGDDFLDTIGEKYTHLNTHQQATVEKILESEHTLGGNSKCHLTDGNGISMNNLAVSAPQGQSPRPFRSLKRLHPEFDDADDLSKEIFDDPHYSHISKKIALASENTTLCATQTNIENPILFGSVKNFAVRTGYWLLSWL